MAYYDQQYQPSTSSSVALPPGLITQHDPASGAPYYVNTATGETTWTAPSSTFDPSFQSAPSSYPENGQYTGSYDAPATGSSSSAGGEASSFYGGTPPPQSQIYSNDASSPPPATGPDGEPQDRGMGTVVAGGVAIYLAHKAYKKYKEGHAHSKPPKIQGYGPQPQYGQQYGHQYRDGSQPNGGPPSYGTPPPPSETQRMSGYPAQPDYGSVPQAPSYGSTPYPSNDTHQSYGLQQTYAPPDPYAQSPYPAPAGSPYAQPAPGPTSGKSSWGDPRF